MNFSKTAIKRPVTTIMLMLIIVVLGAVSFSGLSVDLFPKMELPVSIVLVQYPNSAPTEVETMITRPIEQQLATVENLNSLTSMSMDGMSIVVAQFENGTDMNFAGLNMREAVDLISGYLPDNATKPMVIAMNPDMMPVTSIYASGDMPLAELQQLVDDEILPAIERTEGVASASTFGGRENEIHVEINQERLSGYHITLAQVSQVLAAENITLPSGNVTRGEKEMIVRTVGEFKSVDELRQVPITLPTQEVVYLQDLGTIEERLKDATSIGRIDGEPAIGINVTKQTVANTVLVSRDIHNALDKLAAAHPEIRFTTSMDQADFINNSIRNVAETAIMGCLLAIVVCFFFLRNLASTMIIAISIPTSIIATFILMYFTGLTMNILSLSGLAVGIGMLVDDSIVVMENIYRLRDRGAPAMDASIQGTKDVTMPVFTATLTKIAVFLPIVFVQGIAATIFKEFSYTIGFSLICSLLVALTVVPMLCSRLLNTKNIGDTFYMRGRARRVPLLPAFDAAVRYLTEGYVHALRYALRHRKSMIAGALTLLVLSAALIGIVGGVLMPVADEGALTITIDTPYGTGLEDSDRIVAQVEDYVAHQVDEIDSYAVQLGGGSILGIGSANSASITVNLVDKRERERSTSDVVKQLSDGLSGVVGAQISVSETSSMSISMGGNPISISIQGDDLSLLRAISGDFEGIIKKVPGTINVDNSMEEGNPEVQLHINRQSAARYGVTAYQLAQTLNSALSGVSSTSLKSGGEETDITLSLNGAYGDSIDNMLQIAITAPTGQTLTVGEIADVVYDNSPAQIDRQDQVRTATVSSGISGRDLQSVSTDIDAALSTYLLPSGYTYSIGGEAEEMMESFTNLFLALLLAVLLIFMILASQFESLIQPFIIMLAIPFALTGAFIALFITNTPLSLVAFLGIIMLSGIVVNNSILLIDFINQNKAIYDTREEAIINAGRFRLRPILMTGFTTCLGLLPLSLGLGSGAEMQAPMGITVIGGLIFSTLITLILVPVIYTIVDDRSVRYRNRRDAKRQAKTERLRAAGMLPAQAE
ncbi:MAG: efflux RND transporter permease subunit [Clostridiales Family XIII bacterium]|jgi:HAE1 family hydrophobic/amphiphilic exporter-1|nr:efflux RND transporter permease subunit [Clostridiales Family XIII bacterium]